MTDSRFRDVMQAARDREAQQPEPRPAAPVAAAPVPAKRGRPATGKRNDPRYEQVAAYVPKELYKRVRIHLMELEPEGEFSALVEYLLTVWLQGGVRQQKQ